MQDPCYSEAEIAQILARSHRHLKAAGLSLIQLAEALRPGPGPERAQQQTAAPAEQGPPPPEGAGK